MAYFNAKLQHDITYIYWKRDATRVNITLEEGNSLIQKLKDKGQLAASKTRFKDWMKPYTYWVEERGFWRWIYVREANRLVVYDYHTGDNRKNGGQKWRNEGKIAIQTLNDAFKKRVGHDLRHIFGYSDSTLRANVPRPIYYTARKQQDKILDNVFKVDYSSNYPASACGKLPTMRGSYIADGMAEPSEKYPFAFYLNTGHLAELNRFDTRKWDEYNLGYQLLYNRDGTRRYKHLSKETRTLLCPAATEELTTEFEHFYNIKKTKEKGSVQYELAKGIMNCAIGYMHPASNRESYRLYHIAAVTIARADQTMLETTEKLKPDDILQVVVDGIIYKGDGLSYDDETFLGSLNLEQADRRFIMRGTNAYMFFDGEKCVECKHGSYDENIETNSPYDIFKWSKKNIVEEKNG